MALVLEHLLTRPWIGALILAGFLVWIWAVRTIFTSDRFLRKWLWFLLTFMTFTYAWPVGDNVTLSVGIPIGAACVLYFARYGPEPTVEERARRAEPIALPVAVPPGRLALLRAGYGAFAMGVVVLSAWCAAVAPGVLEPLTGWSRLPLPLIIGLVAVTGAFTALPLFLAFRPYWWGKLFCGFAALSWIGHAAAFLLIAPDIRSAGLTFLDGVPILPHSAIVGGCGLTALAAGLLHQWVDPRFGGEPVGR